MGIISRTGISILALAVAFAAGGPVAFAKGHKGSNKERRVRGTVTAVNSSSITVEAKKHESKQFRITSGTVVERLGKHGQVKSPGETKTGKAGRQGKTGKHGKAGRIKSGSRVVITAKDGVAEKVAIKRNHHKGKSR